MKRENFIADVKPSIEENGRAASLRITVASGQFLEIDFPIEDLHVFIENIIDVAQAAARETGAKPTSIQDGPIASLSSNVATQIGLATGQDGRMYLVVRVHNFDLSFRVARSTLRNLRSALAQASTAIEGEDPKSKKERK